MDNVIIYDAIEGVLNECETVMGGVNNIQGTLTNGMVKSVQRGTIANTNLTQKSERSIPISTVNIQKSVALLTLCYPGGMNATPYVTAFINSTGTAVVVKNNNTSYPIELSLSWQVIEFY